jgi:hypothetical protein
MEIGIGIEEYETTILIDILAEGRTEKSVFGRLKRDCGLPHEKNSCFIPVSKEKHEDE